MEGERRSGYPFIRELIPDYLLPKIINIFILYNCPFLDIMIIFVSH
jgi:hypothetical protein